MGFFSRKPKKTTQSHAATTASQNNTPLPSTPGRKRTPSTPETSKEAESPATATPPNPVPSSSEIETNTMNIQESIEDAEKPVATRAKKKHRTRISVTTPENCDKDHSTLEAGTENQDASIPAPTQHFDELDTCNDKSKDRVERSGGPEANDTGVDLFPADDGGNFAFSRDEKIPTEDTVNKNLLSNFEGCDILPDSLKAMLPESWQQSGNETEVEFGTLVEEPPTSYYSDEFASNFLQELLKSGFALIYHQPSLTIEEEKADWQGRSVTMHFKAGVCNALEVIQPGVEWYTMGGGKDTKILTNSVSLLDIHSISVSSTDDMRDNIEAGESEEIQCFFTLISKSGDIHVFEAMHTEESKRLVRGIKNVCGRYSNFVVAGDPRVMVEFFDNSSDPQEVRISFERAIVQVSHSFLG